MNLNLRHPTYSEIQVGLLLMTLEMMTIMLVKIFWLLVRPIYFTLSLSHFISSSNVISALSIWSYKCAIVNALRRRDQGEWVGYTDNMASIYVPCHKQESSCMRKRRYSYSKTGGGNHVTKQKKNFLFL